MENVSEQDLLPREIVERRLNYEKDRDLSLRRSFDRHAKEWWSDYRQIRESHKKRPVPLFVETDDRDFTYCIPNLSVYRPATSLLVVLRPPRSLETPLHALRFVSLIPFVRSEAANGLRVEKWNTFHSFLARRAGDVEDHCILLCSLLLGFGLDAYIAVGKVSKDTHSWVLTASSPVTFWETGTGQRTVLTDSRISFYSTISCVFTTTQFYANIQPDDRVGNVLYDFGNPRHWKAVDSELLKGVAQWNYPLPLLAGSEIDVEGIERKVKARIGEHRMNVLLVKTVFDEGLECVLMPALANYEMERLCGVTFGNEEFKDAIAKVIPQGHTFKAFPVQTRSVDEERIFGRALGSEVGKDILETVGDEVRFAVRVKTAVYPENTVAVWTIIAVRYREVA